MSLCVYRNSRIIKSLYKSLVSGPIGLTEEEITRYLCMCAYVGEYAKLKTCSHNTSCRKTNKYGKSHIGVLLTELYLISYCLFLSHIHIHSIKFVETFIQTQYVIQNFPFLKNIYFNQHMDNKMVARLLCSKVSDTVVLPHFW